MGLFFYTKIGSIISIGDLPTTNIIEPDKSVLNCNFFSFRMNVEVETNFQSLKKAIVDYIDYYNNKRIKVKLKGLSPVQYITKSFQ